MVPLNGVFIQHCECAEKAVIYQVLLVMMSVLHGDCVIVGPLSLYKELPYQY